MRQGNNPSQPPLNLRGGENIRGGDEEQGGKEKGKSEKCLKFQVS
jgi:hypothetical protein